MRGANEVQDCWNESLPSPIVNVPPNQRGSLPSTLWTLHVILKEALKHIKKRHQPPRTWFPLSHLSTWRYEARFNGVTDEFSIHMERFLPSYNYDGPLVLVLIVHRKCLEVTHWRRHLKTYRTYHKHLLPSTILPQVSRFLASLAFLPSFFLSTFNMFGWELKLLPNYVFASVY